MTTGRREARRVCYVMPVAALTFHKVAQLCKRRAVVHGLLQHRARLFPALRQSARREYAAAQRQAELQQVALRLAL